MQEIENEKKIMCTGDSLVTFILQIQTTISSGLLVLKAFEDFFAGKQKKSRNRGKNQTCSMF